MINYSWNDSLDNYKKYTFNVNPETKKHIFLLELLDAPVTPYNSIFDIYRDILNTRQTKFVDVLYSGGLDSELILYACLIYKIPVRAITMRLTINGYPINLTDLYYSEKFCRLNNVSQKIIDLDAETFLEQGKHYDYLKKYYITEPHVATQFWLFEQCEGFPVIGGDYTWPWVYKPLISPHRHSYAQYDRFLKDNNIHGIGNMMSYSLSSNLIFLKQHISLMQENKFKTNFKNIPIFKKALCESLGYKSPELRLRSYGWEFAPDYLIDIGKFKRQLEEIFGTTESSISWNEKINELIGAEVKYNDKFR